MKAFSPGTLKFIQAIFSFNLFFKTEIKKRISRYKMEIRYNPFGFLRNISKTEYKFSKIEKRKLVELYSTANTFRSNKKLIKSVVENFIAFPFLLFILILPLLYPLCFYFSMFSFFYYPLIYISTFIVLFFVLSITIVISNFVQNFENRIGFFVRRLFDFSLILGFSYLIYSRFNTGILWIDTALECSLITFGAIIILLFLIKIFAEYVIDLYFFSKKINITDELIIESIYNLTLVKNWGDIFRKRRKRNNYLSELERLAKLFENDWSSHIKSSDSRTESWKKETLCGIAASIRKLKRELILPSSQSPIILETRFKEMLVKVLTHDLKGLIDENVPAYRIRKKTYFEVVRSIIVTITPILVFGSIKIFNPELVSENHLNLGLIISLVWFLVCLLLWLDPNLGDKVAAIRSVKGVFKKDYDE